MAPIPYLRSLKVAVALVFIFSLIFLPRSSGYRENIEEEKMVLGSKPPVCENKCLNCKPCIATLVIPAHKKEGFSEPSRGEDGSYYLLSWKCKCGNKFYQP